MKNRLMQLISIITIGIIVLTGCPKPEPDLDGDIQGTVYSNGKPIDGVQVKINTSPNEQTATTNINGTFLFKDLLPISGGYQLTASKVGYISETKNVNVIAGDTKTLDFTLTENLTLTVLPTNQSVNNTTGTTTFTVTSNTTWNATEGESWLSVTQSSTSGNGTITVSYEQNNGSQRIGTITISGTGIANQTVTITQNPVATELTITPTNLDFTATEQTKSVSISSNTNWTANSNQEWCTLSQQSGTNNGNVNIKCSTNNTTSARNAIVTFSANGISSKQISISQQAGTANITITSPTSSTNWMMTTSQNITWSDNLTEPVKIELYKGTTLITTTLPNSESGNSYNWNIPLTLTTGNDYKIKITSTTNSFSKESDNFTILKFAGTLTDIDGNNYNSIQIGTQIWMTVNLKVTKAPNGNAITSFYYQNSTTNLNTYGRLYRYDDAIQACPIGWHLPTDNDWQILVAFLGGFNNAGTMLISDNNVGFKALYAGTYGSDNTYYHLGSYTWFWTSTTEGTVEAYSYRISKPDANVVGKDHHSKMEGFSIRCIKNQ